MACPAHGSVNASPSLKGGVHLIYQKQQHHPLPPHIKSLALTIDTLLQTYIYGSNPSRSKPSHLNPRIQKPQLRPLLPLHNLLEFLKIQPPRPAPLRILMLNHI